MRLHIFRQIKVSTKHYSCLILPVGIEYSTHFVICDIKYCGPWQTQPIAQIRVHNNLMYQHADTKSNPNPNSNPNPTTKQHTIVNIQLNIVACPSYPEKFIRDMLHRLCDLRL